jgi:hypothetical protein
MPNVVGDSKGLSRSVGLRIRYNPDNISELINAYIEGVGFALVLGVGECVLF